MAIGPVIGGVLLNHFSWSSVFWVNLPIGALALGMGWFFVPESKDPMAPRLDPLGALLSIVGLGALLFGIIEGPSKGWGSTEVLIAFAFGIVGVVAFIVWELHTDHPMLDMSFFRNPRFSAANTAITLVFFAMFGSMFLMTQYWQFVHGYSPLQAGIRLIPFAMVMMVTAPSSARVVEVLGTKRVVTLGLGLVAAALLLLSTIHRDTSYFVVISFMCVMAVGMGLTMAPATESVMGSLATGEGRCRLRGERHHPPDGWRPRCRDRRNPRGQQVRGWHQLGGGPGSGSARIRWPRLAAPSEGRLARLLQPSGPTVRRSPGPPRMRSSTDSPRVCASAR